MVSDFFRSITSIPTPFNMVVLIVLIASVAGIITAISKEVGRYFCVREETDLKRDMLDRGMNAQEIEQVIRAKIPRNA